MKTLLNASQLLENTRKLSTEVLAKNADDNDQRRSFPRANIERLGEAGLLGLLVPKEFGGAGGGVAEMAEALELMAQACASTAMVMLMHYCGTAVMAAKASDKLKRELLPQIAAGKHLTTLAFSEAGSGGHFYTPVSEPKLNARAAHLNARKNFVTSASEADSYVVSTRRPGASGPTDLNLYLVRKGANGLNVERQYEGLGLAANDSAAMRMEEVVLTDDERLGDRGARNEADRVALVQALHFRDARPPSRRVCKTSRASSNPGRPASRAGLQVGERVVAVNGRPVSTRLECLHAVIGSGGSLQLTVVDSNSATFDRRLSRP